MKYRGTLLVVKDCKKALSFYSQMFGLELIQELIAGTRKLYGSMIQTEI